MAFSISAALIFQIFPIDEIGWTMGYIGPIVPAGCMAGPALGGFIVSTLGWQYIFLINVPIGIAMALPGTQISEGLGDQEGEAGPGLGWGPGHSCIFDIPYPSNNAPFTPGIRPRDPVRRSSHGFHFITIRLSDDRIGDHKIRAKGSSPGPINIQELQVLQRRP
jgi:MFS family permease